MGPDFLPASKCMLKCFIMTTPTGLSCPGKDSAGKCSQDQEGLAPTMDVNSPPRPTSIRNPSGYPSLDTPKQQRCLTSKVPCRMFRLPKQPLSLQGGPKDFMNMATPAKPCVHERKSFLSTLALRTGAGWGGHEQYEQLWTPISSLIGSWNCGHCCVETGLRKWDRVVR